LFNCHFFIVPDILKTGDDAPPYLQAKEILPKKPDGSLVNAIADNDNQTRTIIPEVYAFANVSYTLHKPYPNASSPDYHRAGADDAKYKKLNYKNDSDGNYPRVHWADVRSDLYSKFTVCTLAGVMDVNMAAEIMRDRTDDKSTGATNASAVSDYFDGKKIFRRPAPYNLATNNYKNMSTCIQECIVIQGSRVEQNEKALEMAIEQSKMAYEKAFEIERETKNMIEDVECSLTQRADLSALLAVNYATSLVC
jgi:hypothetical protein